MQCRISEGKKITNSDRKYFKMAEDSLYGELAIVLDMEKEKEPEQVKPVVRPVATPTVQPAAASSNSRVYNDKVVKAPLPGVIIDVKVKVGDTIEAGDTVVILEAMKMNNNLTAECSGTVVAVNVQPGNSVMEDDVLVEIQ